MVNKTGLKIIQLSKDYAEKNYREILALENNWKEIGDEAWTIENLIYNLPMKWELSHVALLDQDILGYQIGSFKDNASYLNKIVVDKKARGLNIGRGLLRPFLKKSLESGIERVCFKVRVDNPAVKFYDKLGFIPMERDGPRSKRDDGKPSYFYDSKIREVIANV
jgi:ribosomal protein S18 acetylase RimI-like enzyme